MSKRRRGERKRERPDKDRRAGERAANERPSRLIDALRHVEIDLRDAAAFAWLAVVFTIGLRLTWGTWIDVQIDFGREAYVPWRMSEGDVLYRDLAYFNGPLSPSVNAQLFRWFGASLGTLFAANACLLVASVALAYFWIRRRFSRGAATLACTTFLALFAFNQYVFVGNYDWLGPYSHEMTHGLILAGASLACLIELTPSRPRLGPALAGVLFGLVALTKVELALATMAGAVVWFVLRRIGDRRRGEKESSAEQDGLGGLTSPARRLSPMSEIVFVLCAMAPAAVAILALSNWLPLDEAAASVAGSWRHAFAPAVWGSRFYRLTMGTEYLGGSLALLVASTGGYAIFLYGVGWLAKASGPDAESAELNLRRRDVLVWSAAAAGLVIVVAALLAGRVDVLAALRPWPIVLAALFLAAIVQVIRRRRVDVDDPHASPSDPVGSLNAPPRDCVGDAALLAFAGAALLKIALFVTVARYGFVLALPATLLVLAYAWERWPAWLARRGGSRIVARAGLLALWTAITVGHLALSRERLVEKDVVVGQGADRFRADYRGSVVEGLAEELARNAFPGETVAVLPEGALLNFLVRRESGLRYLNFTPVDLALFGEERVFADLYASPPVWIVLLDRDTSEYGAARFGIDYGGEAKRWIDANYETFTSRRTTKGAAVFEGRLLLRKQ